MDMKSPYMIVGLSHQGGKPSLRTVRGTVAPDGTIVGDPRPLNEANPTLEHLNRLGTVGAQAAVGGLVIAMLNQAHMNDFAAFPNLVPTDTGMHSPRDCVNYLIGQSKALGTSKFVSAIDKMFETYPNDLAGTDLERHWAIMKPRVEKFPG